MILIDKVSYDEEEGLTGLEDRSSAPHHTPTATPTEVVEKVLWLRQQYHFGPEKISMYLQRYHDVTISPSGVWRILHKAGISRLPASQRHKRTETQWKRYEKQRPGHQLQVDVKFIESLRQAGKAKEYGYETSDRGRIHQIVKDVYYAAH